ncbi:hypothetical protein TRVL_09546 [Trypanosoma vivax]|nr:hypothetical protein TRVL_09546 [Trypanosoma vivax]
MLGRDPNEATRHAGRLLRSLGASPVRHSASAVGCDLRSARRRAKSTDHVNRHGDCTLPLSLAAAQKFRHARAWPVLTVLFFDLPRRTLRPSTLATNAQGTRTA